MFLFTAIAHPLRNAKPLGRSKVNGKKASFLIDQKRISFSFPQGHSSSVRVRASWLLVLLHVPISGSDVVQEGSEKLKYLDLNLIIKKTIYILLFRSFPPPNKIR